MRVLALDVGERRIGLAISDPEGRLAVPLETLRRTDEAADLRAIAAVVEREEVGGPRGRAGCGCPPPAGRPPSPARARGGRSPFRRPKPAPAGPRPGRGGGRR